MSCPTTVTCPPTTAIENRILGFNARYQMGSLPTGQVTFVDTFCLDEPNCSRLGRPIQVGVNAELTSDGGLLGIADCYDYNPLWVNGLIRSYTRTNGDDLTKVDVSSYFEYLGSKPIITQQFKGYWLSTVIDTVFRYYAGVPLALFESIDFTDIIVTGPVQGTGIWQELEALAIAGQANLFVQVGGKIQIERWKDHLSPVEFTIPEEAVISAEPAAYKFPQTTMINLKGASLSKLDCGEQTLSTDKEDGNPGQGKKCVISGLEVKILDISISNLIGDEEDHKNSELYFSNVSTEANTKKVKDKTISTKVRKNSGYFGPTPTNITYEVRGRRRSKIDEAFNGNYRDSGFWENPKGAYNVFMRLAMGAFPVPFSSFGLGAFGSPSFLSENNKEKQNPIKTSLQQVETLVVDPTHTLNGVSQESLENKYLLTKTRLFKLGIRRLQEIKMAQNTWNVETIYLPCIRLNQVVEFQTLETADCPQRLIKGIVAGIDVDHSVEASTGIAHTSMKLSIMDTSCLNTTVYTSGNLMDSTCAGADSTGLTPWQTSQYSMDSSATVSGCGAVFATAGSTAFLHYAQSDINVGDTFTISFRYEQIQGTGSMIFSISNSNFTLALLNGTGVATGAFTASGTSLDIRWDLITPPNNTYFKICDLTLIQIKTA